MIKPAETIEGGSRNDDVAVENWLEELKRRVPTDWRCRNMWRSATRIAESR